MIFILLTLLAALALAAVSGWFSIVGMMAIYAGAPMYALVMGIVLELGKLVSTSWIYRNWDYAGWALKGPLIAFTLTLMLITSIGVFGFLSKSHLEQGAKTIDNAPRVERLEQQITREKSVIADNEKVINQLDATINSYLGRDRADRSVVIRRSQAPQRKQLRDEIDAANKKIETFNEEKFKLQSEIRNLELEVGPIRYIAELMYGSENNSTKNIEGAVKIFTLLIVSVLDPLAIILLVAANHSLMRRQNEKVKIKNKGVEESSPGRKDTDLEDNTKPDNINDEVLEEIAPEEIVTKIERPVIQKKILDEEEKDIYKGFTFPKNNYQNTIVRSPTPTRVFVNDISTEEEKKISPVKWEDMNPVLRELVGSAHFIPQKVNEETNPKTSPSSDSGEISSNDDENKEIHSKRQKKNEEEKGRTKHDSTHVRILGHKYPKALSWLTEFKR